MSPPILVHAPRESRSLKLAPQATPSHSRADPCGVTWMTQAPATTISGTDVRLGAPDGDQPGWVASTLPADTLTRLGLRGEEDQLSPSDICLLESWAGALLPPTLSGMSPPAPLLQGRGNGWADERVTESVRKRHLPAQHHQAASRPGLGWEVARLLPVPLGNTGVCPPTWEKGGTPLLLGRSVFVLLAKLGWG